MNPTPMSTHRTQPHRPGSAFNAPTETHLAEHADPSAAGNQRDNSEALRMQAGRKSKEEAVSWR